ncbi:MAG: alpha/beta hydrolase [Sphingomonadales bacterium]
MADIEAQIDPDVRVNYTAERAEQLALIGPDMTEARARWSDLTVAWRRILPGFDGTEETATIPGLGGDPDIAVRIYTANEIEFPYAVLIWAHGGGYVLGQADDPFVYRYAPLMKVVSVEYRMAPEHRSPAAVRDVCAAIDWVAAHAAELGIDPARIIVGGPSGGGGVAAGAALLNRDRGGPPLLYQMLIYPMIDDRHHFPSGHLDLPAYCWTREVSLRAWSLYVEEQGPSCYAAAIRADDVTGLPPAYIMTGDLDLFRDEDIAYAKRLMGAGIRVDLAVFPGAPHGFDVVAPDARVSRRAVAHLLDCLRQVLSRPKELP